VAEATPVEPLQRADRSSLADLETQMHARRVVELEYVLEQLLGKMNAVMTTFDAELKEVRCAMMCCALLPCHVM
jgi:hypothetical protein